jgi:hypothetical protein
MAKLALNRTAVDDIAAYILSLKNSGLAYAGPAAIRIVVE